MDEVFGKKGKGPRRNWDVGTPRDPDRDKGFFGDKPKPDPKSKPGAWARGKADSLKREHTPEKVKSDICGKRSGCMTVTCHGKNYDIHKSCGKKSGKC